MADMPALLASLPQDRVPLLATNLVGVDSLRQLLGAASVTGTYEVESATTEPHPGLKQLVDELASDGHGLIMLMGKGGVGKTTLAAAVAVELASRGLPVHLTTSDPAAHLGRHWQALPSLEVSRIDPHAETERYRAQVLATKGRVWMPRVAHCWKKICVPLHRRDCRVSGLLADHSRGWQALRGDGYGAHWPYPLAA